MLTCSWSTATRKRPRNRQMLIRTLCHSYTTRWRAKSTSPGRLSRKFWSQHPSCLSHFVSFAKTTAPPETAQRFPSALQPKSQCLTPWWVWYLLTLDRLANYHSIHAWSNLVIVSFDKSTCGPPARCSWQHPSPPDPPVASDSQKRKNQHGGVQKTGDESYKGLCDTCVNMYVCVYGFIYTKMCMYIIYILLYYIILYYIILYYRNKYIYIYIYTYISIYTYVYIYIPIYVCMYVHMYIYIYIWCYRNRFGTVEPNRSEPEYLEPAEPNR